MAAVRKNYTVLVPYPVGGGHWTKAGDKVDLLDVQAQALRQAKRIKLTSELEAEQAAAAAEQTAAPRAGASKTTKKAE